MKISQTIRLKGTRKLVTTNALINTGAEISIIPLRIAIKVGAWKTGQKIDVIGIHGEQRKLPLGVITFIFLQ